MRSGTTEISFLWQNIFREIYLEKSSHIITTKLYAPSE